jgi:coenzyme Q-binding protein COQ10
MPEAKRTIIINAPASVLFKVITDYERYPEFLKEVEKIDVLSRSDGRARVRYTVNLIKRVQYTIDLTEIQHSSVRWTLVESGIMKFNDGGWALRDLGDGRTEATYGLEVRPKGVFVPKRIMSMLTDKSLPATLEAFKKRAEALA